MADYQAKTNKDFFPLLLFWLAGLLLLLPWVYIQQQTSINSDVAWLSICAQRLLNGGTLLQDCYDTNPPLSILIYIPFIWLSHILFIPAYTGIFWITLLWIGFAVYSTQKILASFPFLNIHERRILTLTYLCAVTIIPTLYYAERDHFLAIMILPFILTQLSITYRYEVPKLTQYFVLFIGGIALLLKPHFGLVPAFLFLHRIIVQKRFWVITDKDFIILFALSLSYVLFVLTYFQGFVNVILPDILQTYLYHNNPQAVYMASIPYALQTLACFIALLFIKQSRSLLTPMAICALLSLIIFIIQMKGFTYHRLPLYAVLFPLSSIVLFKMMQIPFKEKFSKPLSYGFMVLVFALSYLHSPLRPNYPTHADYQNNEITQYISQHCTKPCSFYITYENMDIVSQLAFYLQPYLCNQISDILVFVIT